jgi:hypothetical protein
MLKIKILIIFILLLFTGNIVFSQEVSTRTYTIDDGLAQSQVLCAAQDRFGYIWFGTKNGISKFDGITFQNFSTDEGLASNSINRIFIDKNDIVWIIHPHAITKYDGNKFIKYPFPDRLLDFLGMCKNGNVLLNDYKNNAYKPIVLCKNGIIVDFTQNIINTNFYYSFYFNPEDEKFWFLSTDLLMYTYNMSNIGETGKIINPLQRAVLVSNKKNPFYKIIKTAQGKIFGSGPDGIYQIEGRNITKIIDRKYDVYSDFAMFSSYSNGNLIYVDSATIYEYDGKKSIKYPYLLSKGNYNDLFVDREDNLYVLTENGIIRFVSTAFLNFIPTYENKLIKSCWSTAEDRKGNIWFAGYGDGLQFWTGQSIHRDESHNKVFPLNLFTMGSKTLSNGDIIFTTGAGAIRYNGQKFENINFNRKNSSVFYVYEDKQNGTVLYGNLNCLSVQDKTGKITNITKDTDGKQLNNILCIDKDKTGNYILAAGGDKQYIFDGKQVFDLKDFVKTAEFQKNYEKLQITSSLSVFCDKFGNSWFGTLTDLYLFDKTNIRKVNVPHLKKIFGSVNYIDSTHLLIFANEGLGILDIDKFYKNIYPQADKNKEEISIQNSDSLFRFYNNETGYYCGEASQNGVMHDSKGFIWNITRNWIVRIDPKKLTKNKTAPTVFVQSIAFKNDSNLWEKIPFEKHGIVSNDFFKTINLKRTQNNLKIDWFGSSFPGSEAITYKYRLKGFIDNLSNETKERSVIYPELSSGKYTFELLACNADNVWTKQPYTLNFEIVPAIWERWWFRIGAGILFLFVLAYVFREYFKAQNRKKEKQRNIEKQFTNLQLKTIKDMMDPHFASNALNAIGAIVLRGESEAAYENLAAFSRLLNMRMENYAETTIPLADEIQMVKGYLNIEKIRFRDKFDFQFIIETGINLEIKIPKMILQIFVENAIKHGLMHLVNKTGILKIEIKSNAAKILILIEDNGIGRERAKQLNTRGTGKGTEITNDFFNLYNKYNQLKLKYEIVDLFNEAHAAVGTKVIIEIPKNFQYKMNG